MVTPGQGDVWWAEAEDKRRSVLVVTRSEAIPVLTWIVVAPVTRSIRGIPTEIPLDSEHGMDVRCAASFDNLQPIHKAFLTRRIGSLLRPRQEICGALAALAIADLPALIAERWRRLSDRIRYSEDHFERGD